MCRDAIVLYSCGCELPGPVEPCMWRDMLSWSLGTADATDDEWEEKCAEEGERAQNVRERARGCPGCWPESPAEEEGWESPKSGREGGEEDDGQEDVEEAGSEDLEPEPEGEWTGGFVR